MKNALKSLGLAALAPLATNAATILIDFGDPALQTNITGWNNITTSTGGSNVALIDNTGAASSITLSYTAFVFGANTAGTTTPTAPASELFPGTVTNDSFYAYAVSAGSFTEPIATVTLTFSGLSPTQQYQFTYFASRANATDNREAAYSLTNGTDSSVVYLNASSNTASTVSSSYLSPANDGTLTLTLSPGPNNNNGNKFYYIGGIQIVSQASAVPEPSAFAALAGLAGLGLAATRRRRAS